MKFTFMEQNRSKFPLVKMSKALGVSMSGFYTWKTAPLSQRETQKIALQESIREEYERHEGFVGSYTIANHLRDDEKFANISRSRVAREMKQIGLRSRIHKKFVATTDSNHSEPIAENLLDRQFNPNKPNTAWISDLTYIRVAGEWAYLVVFIDLFSRKVVGWDLSNSMETTSTINAFNKAIWSRKPSKGLLVHSDRGVQYASHSFRSRLATHGCIQSMSRKGNCWDNAVAESFFSTLKKRLINHRTYHNMEELQRDLFWYIEIYYNGYRKHSANEWLSPKQKELNYCNESKNMA